MDSHFDNFPAAGSSFLSRQRSINRFTKSRAQGGNSKRPVALLGTGYIAEWHAKAIASIRDIELVAVCDKSLSRAEAFARKFDVPRVYTRRKRCWPRSNSIRSTSCSHLTFMFKRLERSLPPALTHFIEKPMCLCPQDSEMLTRLAEDAPKDRCRTQLPVL